jgi:predicted LPLAT superfamily acyltransferase
LGGYDADFPRPRVVVLRHGAALAYVDRPPPERSMKPFFASAHGRHWADINELSFLTGMRLLFWLYRLFGRWPFRAALYPVVLWYLIAKPAARSASADYLLRMTQQNGTVRRKPAVLGVFRHFASFAESVLDKMLLWSGGLQTDSVEYRNLELITAQIASKRGALLICSHLGNLELCRVVSKRIGDLKMTVLTHTKHAEKFNRLLAHLNPESQLDLLQVTELSPVTAIRLAEKIAQGEFIAIAGDRIPVSHSPRVAFANFLGTPAPFPVGPYILASLLQCPVYLLFTARHKGASEIHFELFHESICLSRKDRSRALSELVAEYASRLEYFCRRAPFQWYNFYDFWQFPMMKGCDGSR